MTSPYTPPPIHTPFIRFGICCAIGSALIVIVLGAHKSAGAVPSKLKIEKNTRVVLMGGGLGSRMIHFGHFETELHLRCPEQRLFIRNLCDEGNTPSFRPHSGRKNQLGFPGADRFLEPYTGGKDANGSGHFETEEEWLARLEPDIVIAFFGFNESFQGSRGLDNFRAELDAFLEHTLEQEYNGHSTPQFALVSPTAFEDLSATMDVPDGKRENGNLAAYTSVMTTVAAEHNVLFVDAFSPSLQWYMTSEKPLTRDGALLNDAGYAKLSELLIDRIFGKPSVKAEAHRKLVHEAVQEKNWFWINDFKIPNGVHVFGRRHKPYGPDNYPFELEKIREMTAHRDRAIWNALQGKATDLAALDAKTSKLPPVETNYTLGDKKHGALEFLKGEEALATIQVPEGYKIEQWATEDEFPDLQNPVQMSFDNKGRLWVAVMPSYPHYRPGDPRPNDKLIILEDTDDDGKADKQTTFADKLHLPMGFEFAPEGVFLSQGINLVLLKDTDGDDRADEKEIVLSGFDDHDTHHAISAYCADPSGAIYMCEGTFLRSNVETAYGPARGTNGGFFRYFPQRRHLERHAQLSIPNPWGIAFDEWGQQFFLYTSGTQVEWMLPGSIKPRYGVSMSDGINLIEEESRVRPTSGIEFMSSRHFPDEVQGDMMLNNTIGFLGTKQHQMLEDGTGYKTKFRQDLTVSSDGNYRPVDLEIAPDGSLYIVDWHNPLIGHMQHNARDPNRDHSHGRIYRITYPSRPLLEPAKIHGAPIKRLLDNLKLPEYRTRYRTRRELRGRDVDEVLIELDKWVQSLDKSDSHYLHHVLEALWVSWGMNRVDETLLRYLLKSKDHRARAAAVRVLRHNGHQITDQAELLRQAAADEHGRVQLEAIVAATWIGKEEGQAVLAEAFKHLESETFGMTLDAVRITDSGNLIQISHPILYDGEITSFTFTLPGRDRVIALAEVEIYSGGWNVTASAKLSASSVKKYPIDNLVDGNKDNRMQTGEQSNPWLRFEFADPVGIDEVKIWNRKKQKDRFDGAKVKFFSGKKRIASTRVHLKAIDGLSTLEDDWIQNPYNNAIAYLNNETIVKKIKVDIPSHLKDDARKLYSQGAEIYSREGHCATCHQPNGKGLPYASFPPLADTKWATQNEESLIKLTLNGLLGPIEVKGKSYPGLVPMTPFGGMLNDEEIASVLTYVRNSFGNEATTISEKQVKEVRKATKDKVGFYSPGELLEMHPHSR